MYEKLKQKYTEIRFDKHELVYKSLLSTILGDLQKIEKDTGTVTDAQCIALLKKYRENANQNVKYNVPYANEELHILDGILPKQMSESELEEVIKSILTVMLHHPQGQRLGAVMSKLKSTYAGLYDAKTASTIAKSLIG